MLNSELIRDLSGNDVQVFMAHVLAGHKKDGKLYEEFRDSLRRLSTFVMEDSRSVGHSVDITLALRALERIGGHAKNIGGHVIFLITGKDVRHEDINVIQSEIMNLT